MVVVGGGNDSNSRRVDRNNDDDNNNNTTTSEIVKKIHVLFFVKNLPISIDEDVKKRLKLSTKKGAKR